MLRVLETSIDRPSLAFKVHVLLLNYNIGLMKAAFQFHLFSPRVIEGHEGTHKKKLIYKAVWIEINRLFVHVKAVVLFGFMTPDVSMCACS